MRYIVKNHDEQFLTARRPTGNHYQARTGWSGDINDAKIFNTKGAAKNSANKCENVDSFDVLPVRIEIVDNLCQEQKSKSNMHKPSKECIDFLSDCSFAIEATSFEVFTLSSHHNREWRSKSEGMLATVGELFGRPICVTLGKSSVDGRMLVFYEATSALADHTMVREWLKTAGPHLKFTDANNFHNALVDGPLNNTEEENDHENEPCPSCGKTLAFFGDKFGKGFQCENVDCGEMYDFDEIVEEGQ